MTIEKGEKLYILKKLSDDLKVAIVVCEIDIRYTERVKLSAKDNTLTDIEKFITSKKNEKKSYEDKLKTIEDTIKENE